MKKPSFLFGHRGILLLAAMAAFTGTLAAQPVDAAAPLAKEPGTRDHRMHESFLARARSGPVGLLFLGDSITEGWSNVPELWESHYGRYQPANFGISGDTTQGVLWRIQNGELDGIDPRVLVLMLGTNNTGAHDAAQITAGLKKIIGVIRAKLPETKILLLAIFPRGPRTNRAGFDDGVTRMEIIRSVNADLAKLDDGRTIRFLDLGPDFLNAEGKIPDAIMPDQLHPNAAGYQIWADAMQPLLDEMMR